MIYSKGRPAMGLMLSLGFCFVAGIFACTSPAFAEEAMGPAFQGGVQMDLSSEEAIITDGNGASVSSEGNGDSGNAQVSSGAGGSSLTVQDEASHTAGEHNAPPSASVVEAEEHPAASPDPAAANASAASVDPDNPANALGTSQTADTSISTNGPSGSTTAVSETDGKTVENDPAGQNASNVAPNNNPGTDINTGTNPGTDANTNTNTNTNINININTHSNNTTGTTTYTNTNPNANSNTNTNSTNNNNDKDSAESNSRNLWNLPETPIGNVATEESSKYLRGDSLGEFKIVGYYGDGSTYSGKTAQANHTVAADISVLPMGTKIFIGDTVYTVEDIGGGVVGKMIDIYFNSYEEAANVTKKGIRMSEVFQAVPKE